MTTYDYNSTIIGNAVASPKTMTATHVAKGEVRSAVAAFALSTALAATAGQTIGLFRIPAKARIIELDVQHTSTPGTGSWKVGLSRTAENGGTIIDDDILATAVTLSVELLNSAAHVPNAGIGAVGLVDRQKTLYELASASFISTGAANDAEVDIYATVVTVAQTTNLAQAWFLKYVID
jgi:hypothetical protein